LERGRMMRGRYQREEDPTRVNERIRVPEVLVIGASGEQLGTMPTQRALDTARSAGLDLVEVAPTARPPVCRIMDYGKFKFEQSKKTKAAKAKQHVIKIKEIKFHPSTDQHDYSYRVKHAMEFLEKGFKVKASMFFRGREMAHQDYGRRLLDQMLQDLADHAEVEQQIKMEGNNMSVMFAPKKKKVAPAPAAVKQAPIPELESNDVTGE
jgi:translation initiation factor IF-3